MTNKDLSRQLCELAGIEAIYRVTYNNIIFEQPTLELLKEQIRQERLDHWGLSTNEIAEQAEEVCPNFETPENFVKLLEVVLGVTKAFNVDKEDDKYTWRVVNIPFCFAKSTGDSLLSVIYQNIKIFSANPNHETHTNLYNQLKQALQAQDWRY